MLEVVSLEEARSLVAARFGGEKGSLPQLAVPLAEAAGRVIAADVVAEEGVPPFDRSTVDTSSFLKTILGFFNTIVTGRSHDCAIFVRKLHALFFRAIDWQFIIEINLTNLRIVWK